MGFIILSFGDDENLYPRDCIPGQACYEAMGFLGATSLDYLLCRC